MSAKNLQCEHFSEVLYGNGYYQYTSIGQINRLYLPYNCCFSVLIIFLHRISDSLALPAYADIKPSLIPKSGVEKTGTRPRGMGKLLSVQKEVGLALLRLEHVAGVERGEIKLELEIPTEGDQQESCSVIPFWPKWWPGEPPSKDRSTDST